MAPRATLGRLAREEDFRRVYRDGARRAARLIVLHALPTEIHTVRLGVSVGRRFGRAVARNRLRRRLREAVRASCARIGASVDLIVVPRAAAGTAEYADLRDEVTATLQAAGLFAGGAGGDRR